MSIFVTNRSDKKLKDGYGGIFYEFKKDETVEIPEEVARHIFGIDDLDKEKYLARLGWCKTTNDLEDALAILAQWEISSEPPKKKPIVIPVGGKSTLANFQEGRGKYP